MHGTLTSAGNPTPINVALRIERGALCATGPSGETFEIALSSIALEPGGFDGDFVFCRPLDRSFTIATNDPRLLVGLREAGLPSLAPQLAKLARHRRSTSSAAWISLALFGLAILAIAVVLWNVPNILAASVDALPLAVDRSVGDSAEVDAEIGRALEAPATQAMLEEIVARLRPHVAEPAHDFRVSLIASPEQNAFALPGGRMVVLAGLVRAATSSEEIAGVLAHEMAHVTHRHGMRNVAHRAGMMLALSLILGDQDGWTQLAGEAAVFARESAYSRAQESEADADAVRTTSAAGLDPLAIALFFRRMQAMPEARLEGAMTWLSSHPDSASRIEHVESIARALAPLERRPLTSDWSAVQAELAALSTAPRRFGANRAEAPARQDARREQAASL